MHLLSFLLCVCVVVALPPIGPSTVSVVSPTVLGNLLGASVPHSDALFGYPASNTSISALLEQVTNATTGGISYACENFSPGPSWGPNPIVLVKRGGGCHFMTKIANAQRAGASAVVVVNNVGVCGLDPSCPMTSTACSPCPSGVPGTGCTCFLPGLADDGSHVIEIPSVLVSETAGSTMASCFGGGGGCGPDPSVVVLHLTFDRALLPVVNWTVWTSPSSTEGTALLASLAVDAPKLGGFSPGYFIYDGSAWGCLPTGTAYPCANQCVNGGRYCMPGVDAPTGAAQVIEALRQICVWNVAGSSPAGMAAYFKYTALFFKACYPGNFTTACALEQLGAAKVDAQAVASCMSESGGATADPPPSGSTPAGENVLLSATIQARSDLFIFNIPSVSVGGTELPGAVNAASVVAAVCQALTSPKPAVCGSS